MPPKPVIPCPDTLLEYSTNQQDAPRQVLCRNLGYTAGHYLIWASSGGSTGRVPPFYFKIQGAGGASFTRTPVTMGRRRRVLRCRITLTVYNSKVKRALPCHRHTAEYVHSSLLALSTASRGISSSLEPPSLNIDILWQPPLVPGTDSGLMRSRPARKHRKVSGRGLEASRNPPAQGFFWLNQSSCSNKDSLVFTQPCTGTANVVEAPIR